MGSIMKQSKAAVVLLSGGMDSAVLLRHVARSVKPEGLLALTFVYGQRHVREVEMASRQAAAAGVCGHEIVDIGRLGSIVGQSSSLVDGGAEPQSLAEMDEEARDQPPTYVPHRNMVFLSIASAYAEANGCVEVYYGAHRQDRYGYWDCTVEFVEGMNAVLGLNRRRCVCVKAPFVLLNKGEVLRLGLDAGVDYASTWTCYRGEDRPCGECPSCAERRFAFESVGRSDPLETARNGGV